MIYRSISTVKEEEEHPAIEQDLAESRQTDEEQEDDPEALDEIILNFRVESQDEIATHRKFSKESVPENRSKSVNEKEESESMECENEENETEDNESDNDNENEENENEEIPNETYKENENEEDDEHGDEAYDKTAKKNEESESDEENNFSCFYEIANEVASSFFADQSVAASKKRS